MATAVYQGKRCAIHVESDLDQNWSVCVLSGESDPFSLLPRPAMPLIIKVRAKSRWLALEQGLSSLAAQGRIESYELPPRPAEELAAAEADKARLAAKRAAAAKAADEDA